MGIRKVDKSRNDPFLEETDDRDRSEKRGGYNREVTR